MTNRKPPFSNLELVVRVDDWPYFERDAEAYRQHMKNYYYFHADGFVASLGYIHIDFVQQMPWPEFWLLDHEKKFVTLTTAKTVEERCSFMEKTLRGGVDSTQVDELKTWADERLSVFYTDGEHVLDMDGCGLDLFGVVNCAVHMIGYVRTESGLKYWVPRRSTKMSYPGMLDNTVGGSLRAGEEPIDCIVRECQEEISLDPDYTRSRIKACGRFPQIGDGEVEELSLKTFDEVMAALANGDFKLNCAMTWMAFLIRHGHITAENEEDFAEINRRLHRKHDLFVV